MKSWTRSPVAFAACLGVAAIVCVFALAPSRADASLPHMKLRKFKQNGVAVATVIVPNAYSPLGLCTDLEDHVLVACSDNKIRKFSSNGVYLNSISLVGVSDVDVDAAGNIWAITKSQGVWEYTKNGQLVRHWGALGAVIEVDSQGYVWFADSRSRSQDYRLPTDQSRTYGFISKCRPDGHLIAKYQPELLHLIEGNNIHWYDLTGLACTSNGFVWYLQNDDPTWIQGNGLTPWAHMPYKSFYTASMTGDGGPLAKDSAGYLYSATTYSRELYKYNQAGTVYGHFSTLVEAKGVDVDRWGYIWVAGW